MRTEGQAAIRGFLRSTQNPDGGWGYFPGKRSWLEPTVYAALALDGEPAAEKALGLVRSWALPEGGWRTSSDVPGANWSSALAITLYAVRGVYDAAVERSVVRLVKTVGAEGSFVLRVASAIVPEVNELDYGVQGWPWRTNNASWVEPTAHTIIALKNAERRFGLERLPARLGIHARVDLARKMLLDRRCEDAGWNYGNTKVRGEVLKSYPETTALALLGLHGSEGADLRPSVELAARYASETSSKLALAWLRIALKSFGVKEPAVAGPAESREITIAALQCLGSDDGVSRFFGGGGKG